MVYETAVLENFLKFQRNVISKKRSVSELVSCKFLKKFSEQLFYRSPVNIEFVDHEIKFGKCLIRICTELMII